MEFSSDNIRMLVIAYIVFTYFSLLFTVQFLLNISEGLAVPFYRTTTSPANPVVYANSLFNVSVIELVGTTFTSTVMDPTKVGSV